MKKLAVGLFLLTFSILSFAAAPKTTSIYALFGMAYMPFPEHLILQTNIGGQKVAGETQLYGGLTRIVIPSSYVNKKITSANIIWTNHSCKADNLPQIVTQSDDPNISAMIHFTCAYASKK